MPEVTIETDDSPDIEFLAPSPNDLYVRSRREINVPCTQDEKGIWHYGKGVSAGKITALVSSRLSQGYPGVLEESWATDPKDRELFPDTRKARTDSRKIFHEGGKLWTEISTAVKPDPKRLTTHADGTVSSVAPIRWILDPVAFGDAQTRRQSTILNKQVMEAFKNE